MQVRFRNRKFPLFLLFLICGLLMWLFPLRAEAATVPVTVRIPVACEGGNPSETFTFVLDMETKEFQKPDQLMIRMKAGEEGAFSIHYAVPGTYHYQIRQEPGADKKTIYDKTVFDVDVYVTEDEKGILQAETVLYTGESSEKKADVRFRNSGWSAPSKSSTSFGQSRGGTVQTGDSADLAMYGMLLIASLFSMTVLLKFLVKKRKG